MICFADERKETVLNNNPFSPERNKEDESKGYTARGEKFR